MSITLKPNTFGLIKCHSGLFVAFAIFIFTVLIVLLTEEPEAYTEANVISLPKVSVVVALSQVFNAPIELVGITHSRWHTNITSALEGSLESSVDALEPGTRIKKGQVLIQLAQHAYQADVDSALSQVANTELELVKTRYEQQVALQMGGALKTKFSRLEPQITFAKAEVNAAKSHLSHVRQRLKDTQITAPFDAIILQRNITPGQKVQIGEPLLTIAAVDVLDIQVSLSQGQWQKLVAVGSQLELNALITRADGNSLPLSLRYVEPKRDPVSHQYSLVFTLNGTFVETGLLPEQQVNLVVTSVKHSMAYSAPASALTQDGQVWLMDENNRIKPVSVTLLSQKGDQIWFDLLGYESQQKAIGVLRYPMSHLIAGQQISPELTDGAAILVTSSQKPMSDSSMPARVK
ncbi:MULTISPECIES: efflux RND transporter periplasmic adaptor subunit [Shewanella]|uniref:Efflux RND transporter periplasmic adaptor subunit n=1 Tax=Shewanella psychromarinicola TaxID=2487742 RepID=A0A3N4DZ05_9GAMM|nr:efflux RND transporter periplasmic adaptor subunit [Shewanella psychromarinicola]AZG35424.1 efflux RND transporter periplasmic adaptor subunit [Shewanella psychromarinicola]MCL1084324.1 efflux RND transporter periplasmic adaptor subunit [Shewanella psychromarinicola]RPA31159.1 efflux RND transporter periplasmic adaptor subunit [Shewanella psychromarinicola]